MAAKSEQEAKSVKIRTAGSRTVVRHSLDHDFAVSSRCLFSVACHMQGMSDGVFYHHGYSFMTPIPRLCASCDPSRA